MPAKRTVWHRNPLWRTSDRIEAGMTFVLIMTMLVLAPWAAWSAGRTTYRDGLRTTDWERQHRFPATAVLLEDAERPAVTVSDGMPAPSSVIARARWTGPGGTPHSGPLPVGPGTRRGSAVPIWVNGSGALATPPGHHSATMDAAVVALLVTAGLGGVLAGVHRVVLWRLNRRRLRSWQTEWLVVGPRWSHR